MAARGEAPTVLLLATEADSEWTNGGSGGAGTRSGNSSLDTRSDARSDDASSAPGGSGDGGDDDNSSADNGGNDSSSCVTAASSAVVDDHAGGEEGDVNARKGSGSSIRVSGGGPGVADEKAGYGVKRMSDNAAITSAAVAAAAPGAPAPSSVRSPLPLSGFAAPSLADTEELRDLRQHHQDVTSAASKAERPEGAAIDTGRAGSTSTSTNGNSRSSPVRKASSSGDTAHSHGNDTDYSGDDHDDSVSREVRSEGEEGDDPSGWGGLLEVDVRCSGSGNCPLHEAAASGRVGAVLSLLDLGADVSMANGCGDTALHVSAIFSI